MFLRINRKNKLISDKKSLSDIELLVKHKNSDDNIFIGELFERYTHLVFGVCMKYLRNEEDSKDKITGYFNF